MMREKRLVDFGWRFHRGDIPFPEPRTHLETYTSVKAGQVLGAAAPAFDDSQWPVVDLPHDWVVEQSFDPDATVSNGYLPRGVAWYRKAFLLAPDDRGRHLALEFDGAFRDAQVWLNGHYLGRHASGYTGFAFPIGDVVHFGDVPNLLAVRVDSRRYEGWWYEGGGLYRHVWLVSTAPLHVARWGVCVRPRRITDQDWRVEIETEIENASPHACEYQIVQELISPAGQCVAVAEATRQTVAAASSAVEPLALVLSDPRPWSLDDPALYRLRTSVRSGGAVVDEVETGFGFREISFSPSDGFLLNGRRVNIQGACNHQDHAGVGVALPDALQTWRIRRLKESGCNAYRAAHHPPTPELLEACDREGMLVLDENRYLSSSPEALAELEDLVRRDRNHPCVFLWSICNEEFLQASEVARRIAATQCARVRRLDPTRPVTGALLSYGLGGGVEEVVDVVAVNYNIPQWDALHRAHPDRALVATETTAAVATRGVYAANAPAALCDTYDRTFCPGGTTIRETCVALARRPFMMGGFVWVGFDYRGEPGPHGWPAKGVHLGFLDSCGFPKDAFHLYQAFWRTEPMVHLLPHWNWTGREGERISVVAYSNGDAVELFVNDRSLGARQVGEDKTVEWLVPFEPGTLRAEARVAGRTVARTERVTTGPAAGVRLVAPAKLTADAEDTAVISVEMVDGEGRLVPTANHRVTFAVEGPARVLGVGNGDPTSSEPDKASHRTTFNGLCQLLLQSTGEAGRVRVTAEATGLVRGEAVITAVAAKRRPFVASPARLQVVGGWRRSGWLDQRPEVGSRSYAPDAWETVTPQSAFPNTLTETQWVAYRADVNVPPGGAKLVFSRVQGRGALFVDGKEVHAIATDTESFSVPVAGTLTGGPVRVDVILENVRGGAGICGVVWLIG